MQDRTANLLGALGLAVADRIAEIALEVLDRAGETPAALVVIGYGLGPSNDQLRRILGLSHPGMVRLVDRLVADELVERQVGRDRRVSSRVCHPAISNDVIYVACVTIASAGCQRRYKMGPATGLKVGQSIQTKSLSLRLGLIGVGEAAVA